MEFDEKTMATVLAEMVKLMETENALRLGAQKKRKSPQTITLMKIASIVVNEDYSDEEKLERIHSAVRPLIDLLPSR